VRSIKRTSALEAPIVSLSGSHSVCFSVILLSDSGSDGLVKTLMLTLSP
jgi:hypothetical protein